MPAPRLCEDCKKWQKVEVLLEPFETKLEFSYGFESCWKWECVCGWNRVELKKKVEEDASKNG